MPPVSIFPKLNTNHTRSVLQSQALSQQGYMTRMGRLYAMAEAAARNGLARGFPPRSVLRCVCIYIFGQRGEVQLLDAWQAVIDAWHSANRKGGAT